MIWDQDPLYKQADTTIGQSRPLTICRLGRLLVSSQMPAAKVNEWPGRRKYCGSTSTVFRSGCVKLPLLYGPAEQHVCAPPGDQASKKGRVWVALQ